MIPKFLLDTHVLVRWLAAPRKLSREQTRALRQCARYRQPFAISAITLVEIAVLSGEGVAAARGPVSELLAQVASDPSVQILPLTVEVATEVAALGGFLRDPADQTIVSTARVHKLHLMTSDQRIVDSKLVKVVV